MFIQTENTPNPATLKFLPGRAVTGGSAADFSSSEAAEKSPLAKILFAIDGVDSVFLGADFITIAKKEAADWKDLKPEIMGAIMDHYASGQPAVISDAANAGEEDSEIVVKIKELLDTRIRPALASDGGDVEFRGFEDGVVFVRLQGACSGCPGSQATLKHGIENMLKYYVPEVVAVRQVV